MDRFNDRSENFYAAVEFLQVGLHGPADFPGKPYPVLTEQTVKGA
jgi:hypothetical protein